MLSVTQPQITHYGRYTIESGTTTFSLCTKDDTVCRSSSSYSTVPSAFSERQRLEVKITLPVIEHLQLISATLTLQNRNKAPLAKIYFTATKQKSTVSCFPFTPQLIGEAISITADAQYTDQKNQEEHSIQDLKSDRTVFLPNDNTNHVLDINFRVNTQTLSLKLKNR